MQDLDAGTGMRLPEHLTCRAVSAIIRTTTQGRFFMRPAAGRLGMTVLGFYLIGVGVVPYLPLIGLGPLLSVAAIVAGVLILMGR
jgi:hypothetical protein